MILWTWPGQSVGCMRHEEKLHCSIKIYVSHKCATILKERKFVLYNFVYFIPINVVYYRKSQNYLMKVKIKSWIMTLKLIILVIEVDE